jgi:low temperature requirement protein LtrA
VTKPEIDGNGLIHAHGRRATWFELFFDLVFVAGVAQLCSSFAASYDLGGALRSQYDL